MILQSKMSTTAALFIGELHDVGDLLKNDFVITLRVFDGRGKFYFTDETGESRLIFLADEGAHQFRADDYYCLKDSEKLRLSSGDPAQGSGPRSGRGRSAIPRLTYQCSLTTETREEI